MRKVHAGGRRKCVLERMVVGRLQYGQIAKAVALKGSFVEFMTTNCAR